VPKAKAANNIFRNHMKIMDLQLVRHRARPVAMPGANRLFQYAIAGPNPAQRTADNRLKSDMVVFTSAG
jgi:hypothetical protein